MFAKPLMSKVAAGEEQFKLKTSEKWWKRPMKIMSEGIILLKCWTSNKVSDRICTKGL